MLELGKTQGHDQGRVKIIALFQDKLRELYCPLRPTVLVKLVHILKHVNTRKKQANHYKVSALRVSFLDVYKI